VTVPVDYDDCGAQTMLVDPVRPSDFYALVCANGFGAVTLKSTDFGRTFERIDERNFPGNPTAGGRHSIRRRSVRTSACSDRKTAA
jgi:hypothetical protein